MEQLSEQAYTQIKCKEHDLSMLAIVLNHENVFKCFDCLEETQTFNKSIHLESLVNKEDKVIRNWHLKKENQEEDTLNQSLHFIYSKIQFHNEIVNEITNFFEEIQKKIYEYIENEKKSFIQLAQSLPEDQNNLQNIIYQYSLQGQLKSLIKEMNDQNMIEIQAKITELTKESSNSLKQNSQEINELINNYNTKVENFENIKKIFQSATNYQKLLKESKGIPDFHSISILKYYANSKFELLKESSKIQDFKINNFKEFIMKNNLSFEKENEIIDSLQYGRVMKKEYNTLSYEFIKSTFEQSNQIIIENNNIFKNQPNVCQSIQSKTEFSDGVHSFIFRIISLPNQNGHFFISLCDNKNRMYDPIWDCLCCNDSHFEGDIFRNSLQCLQSGSIFKVTMDFPKNKAIIKEMITGKQRICTKKQLKDYQNLRFALCWGFEVKKPQEIPIQILHCD